MSNKHSSELKGVVSVMIGQCNPISTETNYIYRKKCPSFGDRCLLYQKGQWREK